MKKILVLFLIVTALVAGAAFVACGGDDDKDDGGAKPVAQENGDVENGDAEDENGDAEDENGDAEDEEDEDEDSAGGGGNGGGSLEDVPIYPGAQEVASGEWSGSEAMIPAIGGGENPEDFTTVKYGMYETDDDPDEVFDWYKDKMSGWNEDWVFSSSGDDGAGSVGIWSKDGGKTAAWILVSEDDGTTSLTIMTGSQ